MGSVLEITHESKVVFFSFMILLPQSITENTGLDYFLNLNPPLCISLPPFAVITDDNIVKLWRNA